ncbi:helix-turn-helix transcriptional regulator [uncultured Lamprocystis sp.]|jgi:transcriptional regulator with XRE-family HTH domain|uniref:helix-turn-helix domain-containing protein n=1 Tax=uncultured Lamprocystis sp. TaxID=543132 RepID=UPI0025ED1C8E|nr:helix-turn-helix transcriptional regulator [uncultured Lamprocystis sp.]
MSEMAALKWYRDLADDTDYLTEDAKIGFAVCVERRMKQQGISKTELAHRLGTSQAYVTKILRGDSNLTIKSMVELAAAVDGALHLHLTPRYARVQWLGIVQNEPEPIAAAASVWANHATKGAHGYLPVAA